MVGFTCDSVEWKQALTCRLALIGVDYGNEMQFRRDNLSSGEQVRIQKRFETEVLSRIP